MQGYLQGILQVCEVGELAPLGGNGIKFLNHVIADRAVRRTDEGLGTRTVFIGRHHSESTGTDSLVQDMGKSCVRVISPFGTINAQGLSSAALMTYCRIMAGPARKKTRARDDLDDAPENALLRSLSKADLDALKPHLHLVDLKTGSTLYEMEDPVEWVYLPEVGLLSVITMMVSGAAIETSIVGREGGVGFIEALGSGKIFSRVIVQVPGKAYRVLAKFYCKAFDSSAPMRKAVHRQIELLQAEGRQAIACHVLHEVKPRFNRWLLECQDLAGGVKIMPLKQEFLAVMLGVSRTTVTRIAMDAQKRGLLKYSRGAVEILDRAGLEKGACECRASVQQFRRELEPDSVLGGAT